MELPGQRVAELVGSGDGLPFARGGKTLREWVQLLVYDADDWAQLIDESVNLFSATPADPGRSHDRTISRLSSLRAYAPDPPFAGPLYASPSSAGGAAGGGGTVSVVVVVELPRPTAQATMAMRMITPTTTSQIVVLEESSEEVDDPSEESPPEDAWVVSGAFVAAAVVVGASVVSLVESSPDAAVVVTRLAPDSPSSLHPVAKPIVATTRNAARVSRAIRFIAIVMILSRPL